MQLHCQRGSLQGLEVEIFRLVSFGATLEQWVQWLKGPLMHVASSGAELVDALHTAAGASPRDGWKSYSHPYPQRACLQGFECEIFKLVSAGQALEEWAGWLRVPLEHAAARGNLELVDALLGAGGDGAAGWRGCRGRTLLDAAALGGDANVVSAFVGAGAGPDVNVVSVSSKRSALYTATYCGHEAAARRLIQAGADVNFHDPMDQCSVLFRAVEGGLEQLVLDLLFHGAVVDAPLGKESEGYSVVHIAAYFGLDRALSALLLNGADKDAQGNDGVTPLMIAAARGHLSIVGSLLAAGANMDTADAPLCAATIEGHLPIVESLLAAGADVNIRSATSRSTALHCAAELGHDRILSALLEGGADKDAVDQKGDTPLIKAVCYRHFRVMEVLLAAGADLTIHNDEGRTPLHYAVYRQDGEMVLALLRGGAAVDAVDEMGDSPLHAAAGQRDLTVVEILVASGADASIRSNTGETPLHVAATYGSHEVVSTLLDRGVEIDVVRSDGYSALMCAAIWRKPPAIGEALIAAGADVNLRSTSSGRAALHHAAGNGSDALVRALLQSGADKDIRTNNGTTPVMTAAARGQLIVFDTLLGAGADLHLRCTSDGSSLLHHAAGGGNAEIVSVALRHGAYVDALDRRGRSPLAWAAKKGRVLAVECLLAAGADLHVRSGYDGSVSLHHAAKGGHERTLAALLFCGADKDALDDAGMSSLMWAAKAGHQGEALLAAGGVDLGVRGSEFPFYNALQWAASTGKAQVVEAIVGRGANVNDYCGRTGRTALHVAAKGGHAGAAEALIEAGANLEQKMQDNATALLCAASSGSLKIMEVLLEHGAEMSVRSDLGDTPLHRLCRNPGRGFEAAASLLLQHGADETVRNKRGQIPLDIVNAVEASQAWDETRVCNAEEIEGVRLLFARAPGNRAWRRRCWLVMLRSGEGDAASGCAGVEGNGGADREEGLSGAVSMLLGLASEDLFRRTVAFL